MRRLEYPAGGTPSAWGRLHGESFAGQVRELAALRLELVAGLPQFGGADRVLALAERHLPLLEREAPDLHAELAGVAEGAGASPAELVVLNHYTDLKDLPGDVAAQAAGPEEDCSAVYARTPDGPLLGQTWDMHGSACPFVMMLRVPAHGSAPEAWLLTLTGCLGLAGLSARGVGLAINNLRSRDARVGLVWPALVRRALAAPDARSARELILASPIGAGHHYLVADRHAAFGIETSGSRRRVVLDGARGVYVHTNHCLSAEVAEASEVAPGSTSHERYDRLTRDLAARPVTGARDLWERLGSHDGYPRSVCAHLAGEEAPHAMATCAAVVMELGAGRAWAAPGCVHGREPERYELAPERVAR